MTFLPKTSSRVSQFTSRRINERIFKETEKRVEQLCGTDQRTLSKRIEALDYEWDVERVIETAAAGHILTGVLLGTFIDRRWYAWSAFIGTFLLVHGLFGWIPPLAILRQMGFRTEAEIEQERDALRILRGDFEKTDNPLHALAQARLSSGPEISGASIKDDH